MLIAIQFAPFGLSASIAYRINNCQCALVGRHVVHPHDLRPVQDGDDVAGDRPFQALARRQRVLCGAAQPPDERLPRHPDQDGAP
jgi:hypothetical protein